MSYGNKDNGREYMGRNNQNSKMQSMNTRNINSSQQYSNSNSGDNYPYEMKNQRACGSPKQSCEMYNNSQQGTNPREHYQHKNENRFRSFTHNKYANDRSSYYNQQPTSQNDIIPGITQLKEFISEQSELFKIELAKYEDRKSSPSPRGNFHPDLNQQNQRNQGRSTGTNRGPIGMTTSNSFGTIASSNNNFSTVSSSTSATSMNNNLYLNKPNYNKTVQPSGKPNNPLNRNLSHEETSYSKMQQNNKNRISSPNAIVLDKSPTNKAQFTPSSHSGGPRQDIKSDMNKGNKPYSFTPGINSQLNTNNMHTAATYENRKMNAQNQSSTTGCAASNGKSGGSFDIHKKNSARMNGESEPIKPNRVDVSIGDTARTFSNSGNTTDSQDIEFCTPDSPASPCSLRSLHIDEGRQIGHRPPKKAM